MTRTLTTSRVGRGIFLLSVTASGITIPGLVASWGVENPGAWGFRGFGIVATLVFASSGALLTSKRPENAVGWLFAAVGLVFALLTAGEVYAGIPLIQGRDGGVIYQVAWITSWAWMIFVGLTAFAILLFPTGHLPGPRWHRRATWMAVGFAVGCLSLALAPGPLTNFPKHITNRYALPPGLVTDALWYAGFAFIGAVVAAAVAAIQRFRASTGLERQQMKLFALAAAVLAGSLVTYAVSEAVAPAATDAVAVVMSIAIMAIPVAMTIAILRYRLYDIDVVINRALVYTVLTAALLGSYLLLVVSLSRVLDPVTRDSDVAVAASTLAVAALFRPLRTRIQGFIDRRFYRAKYDAARAVATFAARLRDEIEVDAVRSGMLGVVAATVQPRHASLWLRESQGAP